MDRKWIVGALGESAFEQLASGLAGTELWSLLMEVIRERARARTPATVLEQYRRDAFVRPGAVDQRTAVELDRHLLAAAAAFEALELSPVAPLGTCSSVAFTDQHRVLSALRGTELVSDPTNVLALECATRLAERPEAPIRLATCQRVVRAQQLPEQSGFTQHFRMFVLATGGREVAGHGLVVSALAEQVRTMLTALDRLERAGYSFGRRRLEILTTMERSVVGDRLVRELDDLTIARKPLEHAYYSGGVRCMLFVSAPDGAEIPLVDGGAFDWLAKLGANRRHVFVASGMGAQLVPLLFRARSS